MNPPATLIYTRHDATDEQARQLIIDLYAEVYADRLGEEFYSVPRFAERLKNHTQPGWEVVIGYSGTQPIGYAYGAPRAAGSNYWSTLDPKPDPDFSLEDGTRTFVLYELMVTAAWRKTGTARAIHDELLRLRPEPRVSLAVEHDHDRVRALYESWGYKFVGQRVPYPDAPILDIMIHTERIR
ncbi:GNAT family N-acetyltransferase [Longispora sp. K20-0274]|uniref:GNAT family N-acetyltransferase n=1 Tax=Longispora sp. K20-0274 TaxID=3088255 RepID=UPI00399AC51B